MHTGLGANLLTFGIIIIIYSSDSINLYYSYLKVYNEAFHGHIQLSIGRTFDPQLFELILE